MEKSYSSKVNFEKISLMGINFSDLSFHQVLEYIDKTLEKGTKNQFFVTPNPELIVLSSRDKSFRSVLNSADLALADGIGIILASNLLGKSLKNRIPGVDLMEMVCKHVAEKPITVGFLGGEPSVADKTSDCLREKYPGLKSEMVYSGRPDLDTLEKIKSILNEKDLQKLDILFVAFGSPKQEEWIAENLDNIPSRITIGVGGAFDFVSGKVKRAPVWIRELGLEWLFRLIIQPWRIRRQISLLKFAYLVLKEKMIAK